MSRFAFLGRRGSFMQNRLGYKTFANFVKFKLMFSPVLMVVSLVERALLVKLFYENKMNASVAVLEFRHRKDIRCEPMSTEGIRAMIKRCEMSKLGVEPGRCRKPITPVLVDAVKTAVEAQPQTSEFGAVALV
ncbi:hypothetical protein TNCV_1748681 [Trichonephila clavipes]|nr:hypothetical protein TNCV_1748681 [Trichonephila clavipes]